MLKDDITRLVKKPPAENSLKTASNPNAIREKTGFEKKGSGDVASEEVTAQSTDGLFTFVVNVIRK